MDVRLKRAKELAGYAVRLTKDEGLPTMVKRGAGFVRRRFFGKRARYLPGRKVLEAQRAEMAGGTTVILVSHSIEQIERMCSKVAWLSHGHLKMNGDTETVCAAYKATQRGEA